VGCRILDWGSLDDLYGNDGITVDGAMMTKIFPDYDWNGKPIKPYGGHPPYQKTSQTSKEAADSVVGSADGWRAKVFELVKTNGGLTMDEAQVILGQKSQTVTPRFRELFLAGLIIKSGERRLTRSGRNADVWVVK
jgi:hypothetical protein